jgi:hypothetical protein
MFCDKHIRRKTDGNNFCQPFEKESVRKGGGQMGMLGLSP